MPLLIVVFAVGAYGFGSLLRGSEVIVNEIAIVRGAPGATDGSAQVYLGVFSPSRQAYQLSVPGGALLSSPISGDASSGSANALSLDVVQGDPAQGPRSPDRVRVVADDPRRDVGRRAADPGRPAARGRPAPRHRHQRVDPATRTTGRGPRPDRGAPERPRAGRRRHRRHGRRVQSLRPVAVRPGRRPAVLLRRERDAGDRPVGRSAEHDRPADVRPDDGLDQHPVGRRPGRARLGLGRPGPGRGRGPDAAPDRQRPVLPAGRAGDQGRDDVPRGPAALDGRRVRRADVHQGPDDA